MGTLGRGYTFAATETVTASKLHTLIDNGTVTNISQSDFAAGFGGSTRGTTAPTNTGNIWIDTSYSPPITKAYDGSNWVPASSGFVRMTNKSGSTRSAGDVCIVDASNASSFTTTTSANSTAGKVIVMETITADATGVVCVSGGIVTVKTTGTVNIGDLLITSTTSALASAVASPATGVFAYALTAASGVSSVSAILFGIGDGSGGGGPTFGTPALTLGTANAAGSASTAIRTDATILVFDATVPEALGTASAGSATVAARRDHVHPFSAGFTNIEVFNSSGTWTKPSSVSKVFVEVWGGGGGGGGGGGAGAGGGGGGGYASEIVTVSGNVTVTVGSGGAGGAGLSNGGTGGTSSFGSDTSVTGGVGGENSGSGAGPLGGAGGTSSDTINISGQKGGRGLTSPAIGGQGGDSARGGAGGSFTAISQTALVGVTPGGGGAGGYTGDGANGAPGRVVVYWSQ